MKRLIILITIFGVFSSCVRTNKKYKIENEVLDCFYYQHEQLKIDVKSKIDSVEKVFVKHGVLQDNEGKSYIALLKSIQKDNAFPFDLSDELYYDLYSINYIPLKMMCRDMSFFENGDDLLIKKSKIGVLNRLISSIEGKEYITPAMVATEILNKLEEQDFDQEVVKTIGLMFLANYIKSIRVSKKELLSR